MQQQKLKGRDLVWGEIQQYLRKLALLPASEWKGCGCAALASVLGGLGELSKLYAPPLPADICSSSDMCIGWLSWQEGC
jgi:hypothetical protein